LKKKQKMNDYNKLVMELHKPVASKKKAEELEQLIRERNCPLSRMEPHLPLTALAKGDSLYTPHLYLKDQTKELQRNISKQVDILKFKNFKSVPNASPNGSNHNSSSQAMESSLQLPYI
jgi:hypothetical protein